MWLETTFIHVLNHRSFHFSLDFRWDSSSVLHLAAMFKDVPLSSEELGHVIQKVLRMFKDVDLQELPPLVYQLLLLATKVMMEYLDHVLLRKFVSLVQVVSSPIWPYSAESWPKTPFI